MHLDSHECIDMNASTWICPQNMISTHTQNSIHCFMVHPISPGICCSHPSWKNSLAGGEGWCLTFLGIPASTNNSPLDDPSWSRYPPRKPTKSPPQSVRLRSFESMIRFFRLFFFRKRWVIWWLAVSLKGTLPETTNIAPENRPLEKEIPIGNHHFQGLCWFQGV